MKPVIYVTCFFIFGLLRVMVYACVSAVETYPIFKSLSTCAWLQYDWLHALRIVRVEGLQRLTKSSGMHCLSKSRTRFT